MNQPFRVPCLVSILQKPRRPMRTCRPATMAICLALGLAPAEPALADVHSFDGTYTGTRVLTKGNNTAAECPAKEDVSVIIRTETLEFTNSELHKFVIGFNPDPDGAFDQIYTGGTGNSTVHIRGRVNGSSIDADVTNYANECSHHWHLEKK